MTIHVSTNMVIIRCLKLLFECCANVSYVQSFGIWLCLCAGVSHSDMLRVVREHNSIHQLIDWTECEKMP
jgi:hypothetical protein